MMIRLLTSLCLSVLALNGVALSQPIHFPLEMGNAWYYTAGNELLPGHHWYDNLLVTVEAETTMPNGLLYMRLPATYTDMTQIVRGEKQYLRITNDTLYQYFSADSSEHIRFNGTAALGDTLDTFYYDVFSSEPTSTATVIVYNDSSQHTLFGEMRTLYSFGRIAVADSIGIVYMTDLSSSNWVLNGARIGDKVYGNMPTHVLDHAEQPVGFVLHQNYPNPFNSRTTIRMHLAAHKNAWLAVYDVLGRETHHFDLKGTSHNLQIIVLDFTGFASGTYFYRLVADRHCEIRSMTLVQ